VMDTVCGSGEVGGGGCTTGTCSITYSPLKLKFHNFRHFVISYINP
jgi:hypothetical protein